MKIKHTHSHDSVKGRVIWLLIFVALLHIVYPITIDSTLGVRLFYQLLYACMFAAGILVASEDSWLLIVTVATALVWFVFSVLFAMDPDSTWKSLATYLALIPFQATIIWVLLHYVFASRTVSRDVLYAAITVYLLIGATFVPLFGALELLQPGSFVDVANPTVALNWQQFVYYSLVTLTTLGYGDILPLSAWARVLAHTEAVIGVLFISILIARLVGLYATQGGPTREDPD